MKARFALFAAVFGAPVLAFVMADGTIWPPG
jgi:hypothetical protein